MTRSLSSRTAHRIVERSYEHYPVSARIFRDIILHMQRQISTSVFVLTFLLSCSLASAWTGPTTSAPGNNVAAPFNVGTASQVKNGVIGVNGISVFGNSLLYGSGSGGNAYLNFGTTPGASGYGIFDNGGTLQFKNSGGSWQSLQSIISGLSGSSQWTTSGSNIYYNGGNVGIGTASPSSPSGFSNVLNIGGTYPALVLTGSTAGKTWEIGDDSGGSLRVIQGGVSSLTILPTSGNVGIGQVSPNAKFDVSSNGGTDGLTIKQTTDNSEDIQTYIDGHYADRVSYAGGCCNLLRIQPDVGDTQIGPVNISHAGNVTSVNSMTVNGTANIGSTLSAFSGLNLNGRFNLTGAASDWAAVINWGPGSVGGSYGILVGSAANGYSQFQNASGYYTLLAQSSNGVNTNGNIYAAGFYYNSDERLKHDIQTYVDPLSQVLQLRPVTFDWNDQNLGTSTQIGFIAQEVQQVVPDLVTKNSITGMLGVDYAGFAPLLVGSVQQLDQKITAQQQQLDTQQSEIEQLQAQIAALSNK